MRNEDQNNLDGSEDNRSWLRSGPKPLSIHLNIALSGLSKGEINKEQVELMIAGIKKYQSYPYKREADELDVVWAEDDIRLFYLPSCNKNTIASIFLIPSMINKSYILDLMPDHSFVRWLSDKGYNVYLLDWGDLTDNSKTQSFDSSLEEVLNKVVDFIKGHSDSNIYCLGYCMGGLFALCAAFFNQKSIKGLILLASPWNFEVGDQTLRDLAFKNFQVAKNIINEKGYLPSDWIQTLFACVDPSFSYKKFTRFLNLDDTSVEKEKRFVVVEDWLNEGVNLPGDIALTCLEDLYDKNNTFKGNLKINNTTISPRKLRMPTLIVASKKDILVPYESSISLADDLDECTILSPEIGHIGMMTSNAAVDTVWKPIIEWISNTEENTCIS